MQWYIQFSKNFAKIEEHIIKCDTGDRNAISVSISHSFSVASFSARMLIALITWGRLHSLSRNYNEFRENSYEYLRIVYLWTEFRSSANARINYSPVLPFYFCPSFSVPYDMCTSSKIFKVLFVIGRVADLHTWKFVVESLRVDNDLIQRLEVNVWQLRRSFSAWRSAPNLRGLVIKKHGENETSKNYRKVWQFRQTKSVDKFGERWIIRYSQFNEYPERQKSILRSMESKGNATKNYDRAIMEIACDKFNHLIRGCVSYVWTGLSKYKSENSIYDFIVAQYFS